ncbi:MAG TPA: tetratricopeptide repeat protein [Chthoniobacterales bacterium]|nr:tetratricopeptide repeat protein [Chthoniobacterales bacterium]
MRSFLFYCLLLLSVSLNSGCSREAKKARYLADGDKDFRSGAYDRAKIDYMKVLQLDQRNATAFARLGQMWLDEGAPVRAGAFLKKAEELQPNDSANRLRLARVYLALGDAPKAKEEVLTVLKQSPANGEALLLYTQMSQVPEDLSGVEQAVQKFPEKQSPSYLLATANLALRKKDLPAAQKAITQAIALDTKSPESHQALGILHLLKNNRKEAAAEFKIAAELAPLRSPLRLVYADFQRQTEGLDAAMVDLKKLTAKAPDFLSAWTLLARMAFSARKYDETLAFLENVVSRDPLNIDARLLQSDTWLVKREPKKVIPEMEKLDHAFPGLPSAKYRLAKAYLQEDKIPQASIALDEAVAKNPTYAEAIVARADLNLRTGQAQPAADALERVLKKNPGFKPAQLLLADAYRALGRLDDAAAIFRQQIEATPNLPDPYFFLGLIRVQQDKPDEARNYFEKVLKLAPDNFLAIDQLVVLDLKAKDFAAASQRVDEQLKKKPQAATSYFLRAKVEVAQEKWKEAEATLKKSLELDPNATPAYDMLVQTYLATNHLSEAAQEIEALLAKNPRNESALMTLATIRAQQKDYSKASEAYEKLLALNPTFVPALNNLSYIYAEQLNQPDKAYNLAQKARTLAPGNPAVADTLGWTAFKRGDYQQALNLLEESAGKLATDPEIQYHLGMAHYMMAQPDAARAAFRAAVNAPADFPDKAEAQNRLALLGDDSGPAGTMTIEQLKQIVAKQPNDVIARLRLAEAYEREKDWTKAAENYQAILKINPKLVLAPLKLAQIYSGPLPNKEKALSYAKTARALSPNDPKSTALLGRVAFESGDFSWAYNLLQESARQLASDPQVLFDLAWATYSVGKIDAARDAMKRSLEASPSPQNGEDARSFLTLTELPGDPSALSNAKSTIESKLKTDPNYVPALMAMAALDLQNGNKAAALDRYQRVLQRLPDFAPAQKQEALLYAEDPAHAAEAFDLASAARKSLPDDPEVAQLFGQLNYQKKEYARAIQLLQESGRKKPLGAVGLYYLGASQLAANQKQAGRQNLDRALAEGLKEPLAGEAKRALAASAKP